MFDIAKFYEECAAKGKLGVWWTAPAARIPVLIPGSKDWDLAIDTDALIPMRHDPVPEHYFDESTFSIQTSRLVDYVPVQD